MAEDPEELELVVMLKGLVLPLTEEMMCAMLPTERVDVEGVAEMVVVSVEMRMGVGAGLLVSWLLELTLLLSLSVIAGGCSLKFVKIIYEQINENMGKQINTKNSQQQQRNYFLIF